MRPFNPTTDAEIVRDVVQRFHREGGILAETKRALNANGIEFPPVFNSNTSPEARALDQCLLDAIADARNTY